MGPYGVIWKTVACVSVVLLLGMAFHQAAKSTSGRKALHGGMSLPYSEFDKGESGDRWTAERLCRHFKAGTRRAQVQLPDATRESWFDGVVLGAKPFVSCAWPVLLFVRATAARRRRKPR